MYIVRIFSYWSVVNGEERYGWISKQIIVKKNDVIIGYYGVGIGLTYIVA